MKSFNTKTGSHPIAALLIKESSCRLEDLVLHYGDPLGVCLKVMSVEYNSSGKAPAVLIRDVLPLLLEEIQSENIKVVIIADSLYFKAAAKKQKVSLMYGYSVPCAIKGYEGMSLFLIPNYQGMFYNPAILSKIDIALNAISTHLGGIYKELGTGIIHSSKYVNSLKDIKSVLNDLNQYSMLSCDVETYGLALSDSRIGTIAFAWDEHNGCTLNINHKIIRSTEEIHSISSMLKQFFCGYEGTLIYHRATFDIRCLIYDFFMKEDNEDFKSMVDSLGVMFKRVHDTKLILYLATNNTRENSLSLKDSAFEFAGDYAQEDIDDINLIETMDLMEYNLVDCLSTWYVFNKYFPKMVKDEQLNVYQDIFIPSLKNVTHMELIGMPMNKGRVSVVKKKLEVLKENSTYSLLSQPLVKDFLWQEQKDAFIKKNHALKRKFIPLDEFISNLNTGSPKQVGRLLYEYIGLPVLDLTKTKQPATGKKTIKKLYEMLLNKWDISDKDI